jgi:hypothetical protein
MPGVFISYRRDDSAGFAGALERELGSRIGPEHVFIDIKSIEGGTDFPVAIDEAIKSSEIVLILIGSRWLDARDAQGLRRLEKPDDFVRQEVARALQGKARVIPVLLDGAPLPAAEQLPPDLQPLTTRNALELRNSHWDEDLVRLLDHVREALYASDIQDTADKKIGKDFDPIAPRSGMLKAWFYIALAFGVVFVVVGLSFGITQALFLARARSADARVVGLLRDQDGTYRPQLEYVTPSGQTARITFNTGSDPPAYYVGELVPVVFDPNEPAHAIANTFWGRWLFVVIFGGVGIVACIASVIPFAVRSTRRRRMRRLLDIGRPIITTYHSVEKNMVTNVNGHNPFFVITQWRNPVSHELVQFRSPSLWDDPTAKASGRMITVVIDPNNFHRYVMDLSFLYRAVGPPVRRL